DSRPFAMSQCNRSGGGAMKLFFVCGVLAILATWAVPARGALPPDCYPDPDHAPEILDIRVLTASWLPRPLKSSFRVATWHITALASVTQVEATGSGLKPGAAILIDYDSEVPAPGLCGGFNCYPFLGTGQKRRVHLATKSLLPRVYEPCGAPYNSII